MARLVLNGLVVHNSTEARADTTNNRPLVVADSGGSIYYGWQYSGSDLQFRYLTGGLSSFQVGTDARLTSSQAPNFSGTGAQLPHAGAGTPSGGYTGEVRVGTDKIWVQDAGTWKSAAVSAAGAPSFATLAKFGTD